MVGSRLRGRERAREGCKMNMAKYSTGAVVVLTITLHCDYMWASVLLQCLSMCVQHGVYVCVCVYCACQ